MYTKNDKTILKEISFGYNNLNQAAYKNHNEQHY